MKKIFSQSIILLLEFTLSIKHTDCYFDKYFVAKTCYELNGFPVFKHFGEQRFRELKVKHFLELFPIFRNTFTKKNK